MKITMLRTELGFDDGINAKSYQSGMDYDVSHDLARCFFDIGAAKIKDESIKGNAPDGSNDSDGTDAKSINPEDVETKPNRKYSKKVKPEASDKSK